ncbi:MAG: hypothetical protein ABIO70_07565 [Pseudomonadota bacterium]
MSESPSEPCPVCGGDDWSVQKTVPRQGRTLAHGQFTARATVLVCAQGCSHPDGTKVTRPPASLIGQLLPGSNAGYDVMAFVGLKRFLEHRQRPEIRTALREYGIRLSEGEVSHLAKRFVGYLARLHRARAEELQAALISDGGWPMHVDSTGEAGRGTLLIAMAGWRKWVLGAWKIATERADLVLPCLRATVRRFGAPCAAMRDLGRAMIPALDTLVAELETTIPVLACHQHFVADVGKDLLEPAHAELRSLFRRAKVRPHLRALVRDLGRQLGTNVEEARQAVRDWQALDAADLRLEGGQSGLAVVRSLAQWTLDFPAAASGLDFPFDRPYLDLHDRCLTALRAANAFLRTPPKDKHVRSTLERLRRTLDPVNCQVPFQRIATRLRRRAALVDELRTVLRLAAVSPGEETAQDLATMREQLDALAASLAQRRPARGPAQDARQAIDLILAHLDAHGTNLWGHAIPLPETAGGGVKLVARTNALAENFFKLLKHEERRRSGRKNLGQELEHLPAEAALVRNLEHDDYVRIVCGSLDRLPRVFAELDQLERERRMNGQPPQDEEKALSTVLQLASASLSPADRRVVRTEEMGHRIAAAAQSRASRRGA